MIALLGRNCMFVSISIETKNCNKYIFFKSNQIQVQIKNAGQTFQYSINIIDKVNLPTLVHLLKLFFLQSKEKNYTTLNQLSSKGNDKMYSKGWWYNRKLVQKIATVYCC